MASPVSRSKVYPGQLSDLARTGGWLPTGAIAQSMPRGNTTSSAIGLTSGTLRLTGGITIPAGRTVTSISVGSGTQALVTGSNQWFALFDTSRNLLAITADDTNTAWAATTVKTLNLSSTYTPTADIEVYVGVCVVASTPPGLTGQGAGTAPAQTVPIQGGNSSTGLTNPASCPNPAGAIATGTGLFWAYIS